jgi:hypothetical protein
MRVPRVTPDRVFRGALLALSGIEMSLSKRDTWHMQKQELRHASTLNGMATRRRLLPKQGLIMTSRLSSPLENDL